MGGRPSHVHRLGKDAIAKGRVYRLILHDVDVAAEKVLRVMHQGDLVEQRAVFVQADQEINVASGDLLSADDGAEHAQMMRTVLGRQAPDVLTPGKDVVHRDHGWGLRPGSS
jgi:hypothetical protein